ncbi:class I SAM-dependent methyltransferase [Algoriphagus sp. CAU 1675]|uniref:class I SAM-dependent methyltransferase n=1 Tax=Algoriphagus sp. CAU 1675 TaxID=3032597 RepID=UPI0023DA7047|nr:class I SAM-dependent methyltransferase [Algoriphagus sp. CAU 1675]MDF2156410.1 class I SAM-dependent methyltransferase [Algoriphagus sp. CAU 1675]
MSERLNKCPLCKSGLFLNHSEIKDFAVSGETFVICKCQSCDLLFTNPRPKQSEINPYYDFQEYYSHKDESKSFTGYIYNQVRKLNIKQKLKLINKLHNKGKLLDYGCGTAEFLQAAKEDGWKVKGLEPNDKARALSNIKLPNKIVGELEELKNSQKFDVITLFHVLEHIHKLRKTLKKLITILNTDGYIIIAVPNPESPDAKLYGQNWAGWDVPRHLYHFNEKSIQTLCKEFDLEIKEKKPMKFDSYYVSLLSEKYKNPNQGLIKNYLKAFINGMKSNLKAKKEINYSSNLFILQKK